MCVREGVKEGGGGQSVVPKPWRRVEGGVWFAGTGLVSQGRGGSKGGEREGGAEVSKLG